MLVTSKDAFESDREARHAHHHLHKAFDLLARYYYLITLNAYIQEQVMMIDGDGSGDENR